MSQNSYFTTQRGYCHVLNDKLVFNQSSKPEEIFEDDRPHSIVSPAWTGGFLLILIGFLWLPSQVSYWNQELLYVCLGVAILFYIIAYIYFHFDIDHQQLILKKDILKVRVKTAFMQKAYKHIVVYYRNTKGKTRRHFIILRPEKDGGLADLELAKTLFTKQGFLEQVNF